MVNRDYNKPNLYKVPMNRSQDFHGQPQGFEHCSVGRFFGEIARVSLVYIATASCIYTRFHR